MTAFATSWNRARALAPRLAPLVVASLLGGCGGPPPPPGASVPSPEPPAAEAPPRPAEKPQGAAAGIGLVPLAPPAQVATAVPVGRRDPFGGVEPPIPLLLGTSGAPGSAPGAAPGTAGAAGARGAVAVRPAAPVLPPAFRLTGVIRSGGRSEAVVQFGELSGSLRPGDRGGGTTDLLPRGWRVASIDVARGHLTLEHSGRRVIAEL